MEIKHPERFPKEGLKPEGIILHRASTIRWLLDCMRTADTPQHATSYHRRAVYIAKFTQYQLGFCTLAEAERR